MVTTSIYSWLAASVLRENKFSYSYILTSVFQAFTTSATVILSLASKHLSFPNEMSYSVAWLRSVNTTGFEACVHESVFFSGAHSALLV